MFKCYRLSWCHRIFSLRQAHQRHNVQVFDYKKIYNEHFYVNFNDPQKMARAYFLFPNFDASFVPNVTPLCGTVEFETKFHGPIDVVDMAFCSHRLLAHIAYYEGRILVNDKICQDYRTVVTSQNILSLLHFEARSNTLFKYPLKVISFEVTENAKNRSYLVERLDREPVAPQIAQSFYPVAWKNIQVNLERMLASAEKRHSDNI